MGVLETRRNEHVDAWLTAGGVVLVANDRAARAVAGAIHSSRRADGKLAWETPAIYSWETWVRDHWMQRNNEGLVLLNGLQEQAIWAEIIRQSPAGAGMLHPQGLAAAAMRAHRLLTGFAPEALRTAARSGWSEDAAVFSIWLRDFDSHCRRDGLTSAARLTLSLTQTLRADEVRTPRPPILLIGFDRLLETQRTLLDAWGKWELLPHDPVAPSIHCYSAPDPASELAACVQWLRQKRSENPQSRLMVVTTGLAQKRGELERALLRTSPVSPEYLEFEFSLGVPFGRVGLARSGLLLLRWLNEKITEPEVDWLLTSGYSAASGDEEIALAEAMRTVRHRGQERTEWSLPEFTMHAGNLRSSEGWAARMLAVRDQLAAETPRQSPWEWARVAGELLASASWPGFKPLGSVAFQARQRWEEALEKCGSLGFNGELMEWKEFVQTLTIAVADTIFAAESTEAAVLITEPLESAGQLADGIWFLGADEENWPGRGQPHPLLPISLQRETGMPHGSSQVDWQLAEQATARLLASAPEVVFSYARQAAEGERRPSRLILQHVAPDPMPADLSESAHEARPLLTETFADTSQPAFPLNILPGGAAALTKQSLCPFQAFATARLAAQDWDAAEAGLNARQRGQLLHDVLHRVWGGKEKSGLSSLEELRAVADLRSFVANHVSRTMYEQFSPQRKKALPDRFPPRLLELEADRLTDLVTEWLAYEQMRQPFTVAGTEVKNEVVIAGMALSLRLDRVDDVPGGKLVIDYKTGDVTPGAWTGERPDDVQLPLYAALAIPERVEGLAFARVRAEDVSFYGRVRDAAGSLQPGLHPASALLKFPLTDQQLQTWRDLIERLGQDFVSGRAAVDPKDGLKTCNNCGLQSVCRIYENLDRAAELEAEEELDA